MKIKESKCEYEIDLPRCGADAHFQVYDKKQKKKVRADWLDNTGLPTTHFTGLFFAPCGSGKSSLVCSLLTSTKPKSRAYCGVFDKIYFCCPISSLRSMKDDPYESIPDNQIYEEFEFYIISFNSEKDPLTIKFGVAMKARDSFDRLRSYVISHGKHQSSNKCLGVNLHYLGVTKYSSRGHYTNTRIWRTEKLLKRYFKKHKMVMKDRGSESSVRLPFLFSKYLLL